MIIDIYKHKKKLFGKQIKLLTEQFQNVVMVPEGKVTLLKKRKNFLFRFAQLLLKASPHFIVFTFFVF